MITLKARVWIMTEHEEEYKRLGRSMKELGESLDKDKFLNDSEERERLGRELDKLSKEFRGLMKDRKDSLDEIANSLADNKEKLEAILPLLSGVDAGAIRGIITDLAWANENCTVVGLHQIGEAMDDNMGIDLPDEKLMQHLEIEELKKNQD